MLLIGIGLGHCYDYSCTMLMNKLTNYGLILVLIVINISLTGVLITITYSCGIDITTLSLQTIVREVVIGVIVLVIHGIGSSTIMFIVLIHMIRCVINISLCYLINVWLSGIVILLQMVIIAYIGYVLVWGSMSYWGIVVISSMFIVIPCIILILCGNYICCGSTIRRFIVFHLLIVLVIGVYIVIHIILMHCYNMFSSDIDMICMNISSIVMFIVLITSMDSVIVYIVLILVFMYMLCCIYMLCICDSCNNVSVCYIITPFHILPEWYYICLYGILKCVNNVMICYSILYSILMNVVCTNTLILYMYELCISTCVFINMLLGICCIYIVVCGMLLMLLYVVLLCRISLLGLLFILVC